MEFSGLSVPLFFPPSFSLSLSLILLSFLFLLPLPHPQTLSCTPLTSSPPVSPTPPLRPRGADPCLPSQLKGVLKQGDPGQPAGPSHRRAFPLHLGLGVLPRLSGIESEHFKDGQGKIWGGWVDMPWRHRGDDVTDKTLDPSKVELLGSHYGLTHSMDTSLSKLGEMVKDRGVCSAAVHRVTNSRT